MLEKVSLQTEQTLEVLPFSHLVETMLMFLDLPDPEGFRNTSDGAADNPPRFSS